MSRESVSRVLPSILLGLAVAAASAGDREWSVQLSGCVAGTVTITVTQPPNGPIPFEVPVSAHTAGADKAAEIASFLRGDPPRHPGPLSSYNPRAVGSTLYLTCDARASLSFDTGDTKETTDGLKCPNAQSGQSGFGGFFDPFTEPGQPAIFTAGIVTDVGELTATVSAQELNFQTYGPMICQALYQRLAPQAAQYGAQINYAGDRLEVYFDPAYTVTQGGVIFGTSSPSTGCHGSVTPAGAPPCPGDINGDGEVGFTDLALFLASYGTRAGDADHQQAADFNNDGDIGLLDLAILLANYGTRC